MEAWLRAALQTISQRGKLAEAIRYALARWERLTRFAADGNHCTQTHFSPDTMGRDACLENGSTVRSGRIFRKKIASPAQAATFFPDFRKAVLPALYSSLR